jgi:hypothetical protein
VEAAPSAVEAEQEQEPAAMNGSEPMQNDQRYFFSDIFLKFYNIIKIII